MTRHDDLPVVVDLPGLLRDEVVAFIEQEAGWQVVTAGGPLTPALALVERPVAGTPSVVVVDGQPPAESLHDSLLAGALDVIGWPADRGRLLEAPLRLPGPDSGARAPAVLRVAGAGGGAGTSTVALGLGGLVAWAGGRAVVVGGDDLLRLAGIDGWSGPGAAEIAALDVAGGAEVAGLVRPVAGVDGLSVLGGDGAVGPTAGWPADLVVADLGAGGHPRVCGVCRPGRDGASTALDGADLVVARPDVSLRAVAGSQRPVIVVGDGPLDRRGVRRLLGREPVGWLPASARVARAGAAGRVPSGLPGSWVAALRGILGKVDR